MIATSGRLHYRTWMQYIDANQNVQNEVSTCDTNFSLESLPKDQIESEIGLAIDGNRLLGPYNSDGELWTADELDKCNGLLLDDGSYAYVSTTFAPYTVGCWGSLDNNKIDEDFAHYLTSFIAVTIALIF